MAGSSTSKEAKADGGGRTGMRSRKGPHGPAATGKEGGILALQDAAGNRAVSQALRPGTGSLPITVASAIRAGGGQPLDPSTRHFMENRFAADFRQVRIHTDAQAAESAQQLSAQAYTVGQDIVFNQGTYTPHTQEGKALLAHELAHTLQHNGMPGSPTVASKLSEPAGAAEREAERAARMALNGRFTGTLAHVRPQIYRQPLPEKFETGQIVAVKIPALNMATELGGKQQAASLVKGDLLKLKEPHPKGGGKVFYATVIKSAKDKYNGRVGVVKTSWIRPADESAAAASQTPKKEDQKEKSIDVEPYAQTQSDPWGMKEIQKTMPSYIDNRCTNVGVGIALGGYLLYCSGLDMPIFLPNQYTDLSLTNASMPAYSPTDPTVPGYWIHPDRDKALAALGENTKSAYGYYRTVDGIIAPTVFSPATTPRIYEMIRAGVQQLAEEGVQIFTGLAFSLVANKVTQIAFGRFNRWAQEGEAGATPPLRPTEKGGGVGQGTGSSEKSALPPTQGAKPQVNPPSAQAVKPKVAPTPTQGAKPQVSPPPKPGAKPGVGQSRIVRKVREATAAAMIAKGDAMGPPAAHVSGSLGSGKTPPAMVSSQGAGRSAGSAGISRPTPPARAPSSAPAPAARTPAPPAKPAVVANTPAKPAAPPAATTTRVTTGGWMTVAGAEAWSRPGSSNTPPPAVSTPAKPPATTKPKAATPKKTTSPARPAAKHSAKTPAKPANQADKTAAQQAAAKAVQARKAAEMQAAAARTATMQAQAALTQANKQRDATAKAAQNAADKSVAAKAAASTDPKKKGVATRAENRAAATRVAAQQAQQAAAEAQRKYDTAAQAQVQAEQKAGAMRQEEQEARQAAASLGGKAASRSTVFSMGQRRRQELINYWQQRLNRSKNPDRQKQYQDYIDRIKKGNRPDPRQSEMEMEFLHRMMGGSSQRGFKEGREAKWELNDKGELKPETGSTRPDITVSSAMVEIKNYKVQNASAMIKELKRQINMRSQHGSPNIKQQAIIIDLRGQKASIEEINKLVERVSKETDVPKENIQVLTW